MTSSIGLRPEAAAVPHPELTTERIARWLVGLRLVAVSALLIGALLVQTTTEEILPLAPLVRVAGLTYAFSLVWLGLWLARLPARLHGALQLCGDLVIIATLIYLTGGPSSPFAFLFLIVVAVGALMFGLRGALVVAGGAFAVYGALVEAMVFGLLRSPGFGQVFPPLGASALAFQIFVTGAGFGVVALLTSYLAHSLTRAEVKLRGEQTVSARLFALSAAQRILGADGALDGKHLANLLPLEGVAWEDILGGLAGGAPMRVEGTVAGKTIPLGCTVTLLADSAGAPVGLVVHFRDLTEARETAKRERLRERMEAVGEMAAGMAHEIRNPLASISGSAQVLGNVPGLGENERRLSHIIVEESRRLSGIIESFLGWARPPDPQRGPCDIARTLEEMLTLFSHSPEVTPRHRISTEIVPHPYPVVADEKLLRQAFFNLARNAIQAMPQGGTMRIEARPEDGAYVIRWCDEGVGMEPQQVQEIYQPFKAFRQGGTGLGLAVVYSIVTDHGGEIHVSSEPGKGSVFTLHIPLVAA
jgi:two-component system sensor histidine kinase PilS (NtrC family)